MYTVLIILCNLTGPCDSHSAVSAYRGTEEVNANQCLVLGQTFAATIASKYPNLKVMIECLPVGKDAGMAVANPAKLV